MYMNPLCLLNKGRTFKDTAERPGAYKLLAQSTLPKFTAGRRPRSAPEVKTPFIEALKPAAPLIEPAKPAQPAQPALSPSPFAPEAKPAIKACADSTWKRTVRFCKGLILRFVFGRKGRPVHGMTVQTELALEKVKVLQNDLNEDDLEVVLVERKVGTGEKPLARLSKIEMTGEAWIKLTAPFRKKSSGSATSPKAETKPSPELSAQV